MIRSDKRLKLSVFLLALILVFIWGNSLLPGTVSGALSDWVKDVIKALLSFLPQGPDSPGGSGLLRKLAHFTEFAALGLCLGWRYGMLGKGWKKPVLLGILAACIDETIQAFVPGRGPGLRDVCIDAGGVLTGMMILYLGHTYFQQKKANHTDSQ